MLSWNYLVLPKGRERERERKRESEREWIFLS